MNRPPSREAVVRHLDAALAADSEDEKDFRVRQALQLLGLRDYPVA